ncbi:uncharacterized protein TNCV_4180931 [Trichonephila clavipes]|nr:uncharacterized protein TNCV_4180931 [Trichonephila clavipes]
MVSRAKPDLGRWKRIKLCFMGSHHIPSAENLYKIEQETRSMSRTDEIMTSIYERKILRFIFGGIQDNWTWRRTRNTELYQSYQLSGIVSFIKILRIKWAGHVVIMGEIHTTKKSLQCPTNWHTKEGQTKS